MLFIATPSDVVAQLPPPLNLSVPSTDTDGRITVSWDEVPGATYYRLQRRLEGGSWSPRADSAQTTREDSGLTYGMWDYRAQACDRTTCGTWSNPISVFITVVSPPPDKPSPDERSPDKPSGVIGKVYPPQDDEEIAKAWSAFRSALDAGDVSSAMLHVMPSKRSRFEPAFLALGPGVKSLSANWSDPKEVKIYDHFAEYLLVETIDGVERLHFIMFQKDGETWKLAEF